jgi:hypothetical protein
MHNPRALYIPPLQTAKKLCVYVAAVLSGLLRVQNLRYRPRGEGGQGGPGGRAPVCASAVHGAAAA